MNEDQRCWIAVTRRDSDGHEYSDSCDNKATHVAICEMDDNGVMHPDQRPVQNCYACRRHVKESREWQKEYRENRDYYDGF